jgi:WD40 repeat protein
MSQIQPETNLPRVGVSKIVISPDSNFAASISENTPKCVWIWDLNKLCLNSLLVQKNNVSEICWAPTSTNLNISSQDGKIYLWSLKGASVCQVPPMAQKENFKVSNIRWNRNGKNFGAIDQG